MISQQDVEKTTQNYYEEAGWSTRTHRTFFKCDFWNLDDFLHQNMIDFSSKTFEQYFFRKNQ